MELPAAFCERRAPTADAAAEAGEYRIESLPGYTGDFLRSPTKQFVYAPGNIVPTWHNLRDVEVVAVTRWLDNRLPIENVNGTTRTVTFDRPSLFALHSGIKPRTLLGGERLRGTRHSRPVVSRPPARTAVLSSAAGRGHAGCGDHCTTIDASGARRRPGGRGSARSPFRRRHVFSYRVAAAGRLCLIAASRNRSARRALV